MMKNHRNFSSKVYRSNDDIRCEQSSDGNHRSRFVGTHEFRVLSVVNNQMIRNIIHHSDRSDNQIDDFREEEEEEDDDV